MRALAILALALAVVAAIVGSQLGTVSEGQANWRLRSLNVFELLEVQAREQARSDVLDVRQQAMRNSVARKQRLGVEVAAGRMSLLAAAAAFRRLQEDVPDYSWEAFRNAYAADTDEERLCLAVICYAEEASILSPAAFPDVLDRLRAELKSHKERGTLRLPEGGRDDRP